MSTSISVFAIEFIEALERLGAQLEGVYGASTARKAQSLLKEAGIYEASREAVKTMIRYSDHLERTEFNPKPDFKAQKLRKYGFPVYSGEFKFMAYQLSYLAVQHDDGRLK